MPYICIKDLTMNNKFKTILRFIFSYKFNRSYTEWERWQFYTLPYRASFDSKEDKLQCIIILPQRHLHDSNFRCMDFVSIVDNKPKYRLSGCSDVLHFDGIGGYGEHWFNKYGGVPNSVPVKGWNIDCLKGSGLYRIFCRDYYLKAGPALSSFEIYATK